MATVQDAMIYSINDGQHMVYMADHSDGTAVRVVTSSKEVISMEYRTKTGWKKSARPHKVRNKQAESIIQTCKAFINS